MRLKVTIGGQVFHVNTTSDPLVQQIAAMCPMELTASRQ